MGLKYDSHDHNQRLDCYLKEFSKAHWEIEELIFINALLSLRATHPRSTHEWRAPFAGGSQVARGWFMGASCVLALSRVPRECLGDASEVLRECFAGGNSRGCVGGASWVLAPFRGASWVLRRFAPLSATWFLEKF